jgi:hypothetical protein
MHAHETHTRETCAHEMHELGRCGGFFFAVSETILSLFSGEIKCQERHRTLGCDDYVSRGGATYNGSPQRSVWRRRVLHLPVQPSARYKAVLVPPPLFHQLSPSFPFPFSCRGVSCLRPLANSTFPQILSHNPTERYEVSQKNVFS